MEYTEEYKEYCKDIKQKADEAKKKKKEDRTWADRYYIWNDNKFNLRLSEDETTIFDEGEDVEIRDKEGLLQRKYKYPLNNNEFEDWFYESANNFGKKVKVDIDDSGEIYTLVGMAYSYLDYYYVLERDRDGKKLYSSCVGKLNFIDG